MSFIDWHRVYIGSALQLLVALLMSLLLETHVGREN